MNKHRFVWHDLNTKDLEGSKKLLRRDLQLEVRERQWPVPAHHCRYADDRWHAADGRRTSRSRRAGSATSASTTSRRRVASITAQAARCTCRRRRCENVGTFAVTADPTGAVFAPWKSARAARTSKADPAAEPFTFCWDELRQHRPREGRRVLREGVRLDCRRRWTWARCGTYTLLHRPGVKNAKGDQALGRRHHEVAGRCAALVLAAVRPASTTRTQSRERAGRLGATHHGATDGHPERRSVLVLARSAGRTDCRDPLDLAPMVARIFASPFVVALVGVAFSACGSRAPSPPHTPRTDEPRFAWGLVSTTSWCAPMPRAA